MPARGYEFFRLFYQHTTFLTIFRRFPKIFQYCSKARTNASGHLSKIAEDDRRKSEDVSIIHKQI